MKFKARSFQRLAAINPSVALAEVKKFSDERQETLLPHVFREWARSDLDQAIHHAKN